MFLLDLGIKINDNRLSVSLYDKQDNFPFSIVRMPYFCTKISSEIFHSTFGAEILRIAGTTTRCNKFRTSYKNWLNRAQNQGGNAVLLNRALFKYFSHHFEVCQKFSVHPLHS